MVGNFVTLPRKLSQYQDSSQTPVCKPKERPLSRKGQNTDMQNNYVMFGRTQMISEPFSLLFFDGFFFVFSFLFLVKGTSSRKFLVRLPTDYLCP